MIKFSLIITLGFIIIYFSLSPIFINFNNENLSYNENFDFEKNKVFTLRDIIKTHQIKNLKIYLINNEDNNDYIKKSLKKNKILKLENDSLIKNFLDFELEYKNSDVATIEDKIIIYSNEKLIFESQISLDKKSIGFQNRYFGWVTPKNNREWKKIFDKMERYNLPILIVY